MSESVGVTRLSDHQTGSVRKFQTGATRDTDEGKRDYEAFLSPLVIRAYGHHMMRHQVQSNGDRRESDNWQKGIPMSAYMKSMWRHFLDVWSIWRGYSSKDSLEHALCALLFNVQGMLHEHLKEKYHTKDGQHG